jgi:CubicO group peptidase (beta-lactamase class C family)
MIKRAADLAGRQGHLGARIRFDDARQLRGRFLARNLVPRCQNAFAVALILAFAPSSGCAARSAGTTAPPAAAAEVAEAPRADRAVTLPSGATLKVAADWMVTALADGVTLEDPERQLKVELVEIDATGGMIAAIATAWSRRRPGFDRQELAASDSPGREGWDLFRWSQYKTSPEEARRVSAYAAKKGPLAVVVLVDGPLAAAQRRSSQVGLVSDSLRPAGYVRESYQGRAPRRLDAARVAYLKTFIDRMREAADVPGVSVVLFDKDGTLIEEGFGVRERGRPEAVTADSLYIIASNTKALTTLLLARLVDEGRFGWNTPVTEIYPPFKIGDADVTRRILLKHLVCACTGLPRQDLEWLFTFDRSSPQAQLDVLATMKPTTGFGALFQYSNPLASAAGYIGARAVTPDGELGRAYDEVMRDKIFRPLRMSRTTFSFDEALRADHASPHSWDMSLRNVPIDMALNHSIIPIRPAGGAWSSARDYARYVRLELARGRLPDGSAFVTEKTLLARRAPQVRLGEDSWYGMGLRLEDVKGIRVVSHGGSMFGYKSDFFFVPDAGVGGVILTNADSGWNVAKAVVRRTLEVIYDGEPEAEENLLAAVRETRAYLTGEQRDWKVPPDPAAVKRLAGSYRNAALGEIVVHAGADEVVFQFGGWKSRMATKVNPDGTTSFLSIDPGVRGFEFNAPAADGTYTRLTLRDPQHTYAYESLGGGGAGPPSGR